MTPNQKRVNSFVFYPPTEKHCKLEMYNSFSINLLLLLLVTTSQIGASVLSLPAINRRLGKRPNSLGRHLKSSAVDWGPWNVHLIKQNMNLITAIKP